MADGSRSFDAREGGDPTALTAVYRAHAGYVWRVLRHCGVPDPDLDDAVQETFLVVFRRLPELERASLRTWIYAVAVRVASTRRRSQRREAARREQAGHGMHGTGAVDPEAALSKTEAAALVDRLLDELDANKRTVLVLAELEGVKVPEISRILGVNPRTVHSRLRLARESFGSALERMQAREEGNRRVARLRPRPLLEQAANDRPPASRRKAVMAALAVRIEQGAMPSLAGWEALALGSGAAGAWGLPVAIVGALGVMTAVVATLGSPASEGSSSTRDPARAIPRDVPIVRADATIVDPLVPIDHSGTAASDAEIPVVQSGSAIEPVGGSSVRADSTIGPPHRPHPRSTTASGSDGAAGVRSDAATSPTGDRSLPSSEPGAVPTVASPTLDPSTLAAETRLLERAREALRRGDANAALAALDAHAELRGPILLDEARSTRLRALCAAGRAAEANALADELAHGQHGSRWHDVVAAACR